MRDGLKIYACSGLDLSAHKNIGSTTPEFNYWLDNTQTITNTVAVNNLLADINLLFVQLMYYNLSKEEILHALNLIDLYVVCLQFAKQYHGEQLSIAGNIIAAMVAENKFYYESFNNKERDDNLDLLIELAEQRFTIGYSETVNTTFRDWYKTNIEDGDYCGLTPEQQSASENYMASISGIGDVEVSEDPSKNLVNSSSYYLYLYMQQKTAKKAGAVVNWKRNKQKEVYDYILAGYGQVYGGKAGVDKLISIGITKKFEKSPEEVIEDLTNTKAQGIGITFEAFMAACAKIIEVVGAILVLLKFVLGWVGSIITTVYAVPPNAEDATPGLDGEDLEELKKSLEKNNTDTDKLLKYGVIGIGIAFILKLFIK